MESFIIYKITYITDVDPLPRPRTTSLFRGLRSPIRSYAVRVTGPARVAGKYERMGAHGEMPLYKGDLA